MKDPRFLLPAALCLAAALWLAPPAPSADAGALSAVGRSLGGARVALVDLLFLRAESLRRDGRVEEVPALYEAVLELDPENTAAVDFLAATYAYDLLPHGPDVEARYGWWQEAWRLVERGLERAPDDAALLLRSSDLLLDVLARHPGVEARARIDHGEVDRLGLERLMAAARITESLPRRGRLHLTRLAFGVPLAAAVRLPEDDAGVSSILAMGRELLALRRDALADMRYTLEGDAPGEEGIALDAFFARSLDVVGAVRDALRAGDRGAARDALRAFRRDVPDTALAGVLEQVIGR
ncbi:MAG: hypothetical protein ACYTG6_01305 [Planctomycetota bacterium]|jgi:hypothetical protein